MKYKSLKELSETSGKSRYQIRRAIKAGVIRPEWLWEGPGGHKKVRIEHWGQCLEALDRGWGHSDQAFHMSHEAKRRRQDSGERSRRSSAKGPIRATHKDALEGKLMTSEDVARAAGVPVTAVDEAVRTGRIPPHLTAVEDPVPIGAAYGDVVNSIVELVQSNILEESPEAPLETTVAALFQLGLVLGADLDDLERRRVCGVLSNAAVNGALEGWARFDIPCEFSITPVGADNSSPDQDPTAQSGVDTSSDAQEAS